LIIVRPETVVAWHRTGFRLFWTCISRRKGGRGEVSPAIRALILKMAANPLWGAPAFTGNCSSWEWRFPNARYIYGEGFRNGLRDVGITEVLSAPRSPSENPFAERLVGSIRRECLDHVIVLGEKHLRRILKSYFDYYLGSRTHLSLAKDAPTTHVVQGPEAGRIVEIPQVGGLHHRYERHAA
jgi:hypothetical protein